MVFLGGGKSVTHSLGACGGVACKIVLCLVCFKYIVFILVDCPMFLIITFKIIMQVLEMDMAVSAIIE